MCKETHEDRFEQLNSINQDLTFEYADMVFKNSNLDFKNTSKKTLGLIEDDGLYTNLALLLSDQCAHTLKIAVFKGIEKPTMTHKKEFTGSILKQITQAYDYIDLLNNTRALFEELLRTDIRDYPVEAIRESLMNAVVHREYSFSGSIIINIYDDRIEFISLGGLVSGLSIEAIMLGVSQPRNEKLANIFYKLHFIENYGTGIQKILFNYKEYEIKPIFKSEIGAFLTVLPNINYKNT